MDKNLKQFILGAIVVSLSTTAGYLIAPIEVRFLETLTTSTTLIGLTFGIGTLFFAFLSVYIGRLSDKYGRRKFLVLGPLLGIIYPLIYASTYNIFQYMGVKFVWAISSVATGPIFMAHLQDLLNKLKSKGQSIGRVYAAQSILGAGSAFIGGVLADLFGLKAPYFAMALIFVLAFLISLSLKSKDKLKPINEKKDLFFGVKYIFKKPELTFYFIENTAFSMMWGIKAMLFPLIIFSMAQSNTVTGSVFATMGIVAFLMLLFIGKVVDRIGVYKSLFLSFSILFVSGIFLVISKQVIIFWIAAGVFAIGESIHGPMQAVLLTENIESKHRAEILGVDAVFDSVFNTLSPFTAGILLSFFVAQTVLSFYVLIIFISLVLNISLYLFKIKQISLHRE